jgi:transcriptional regulator with XRE-family HTH domain
MRSLGHEWSRQTVSDIERNVRNVTVDELLGLALVLGTPVSELLDPRGVLRAVPATVDAGDPDLPYLEFKGQYAENPTPIEIPGTNGIGIPSAVLRALVESRVRLMLAFAEGRGGIAVAPVEGHEEEYKAVLDELRRAGEQRREQRGDPR